MPLRSGRPAGFTLIELLVVFAIIAVLLTIAVPRYFGSLDQAKDNALKTNLRLLRDSIDKHYADTGQYPASLEALVQAKYLRAIPLDPVTERSDTWVVKPPEGGGAGVFDVKSSAPGNGRDGSPYESW